MLDDWSELVLAAGALGTAAFGIVEGLKAIPRLAEAGFGAIVRILGDPLFSALRTAYGPTVGEMLRAQYRGDQEDLAKVLRQGLRIGLTPRNAKAIATTLDVVAGEKLEEAALALEAGRDLTAEQRNAIGRFELAADARVDAALTLAQDHYARTARIAAAVVAIAIAVLVAWDLSSEDNRGRLLGYGLLVGFGAVPLAPIAKDIVSGLKAATDALKART